MNPRFPIYIVSKGRHDVRYTANYLDLMGVPYLIVVEEQERHLYARHIDERKILVLDKKFQDEYDTCDKLGNTKSKGPGPARNFAWEHSIKAGAEWHWVMDDNIRSFRRFNHNEKVKVTDGSILRATEDFTLRYTNIGMSGPNYCMFVAAREDVPPFVMNTRIYSCNLIRNNLRFRWRGRYNEDTDLSLRILKFGMCTVQFNAFLQEKMPTQTVKGGNTEDFYRREGTVNKSRMLLALHPDVTRMVHKFGRVHHYVDYNRFNQKLIRDERKFKGIKKVNEYGMKLTEVKK